MMEHIATNNYTTYYYVTGTYALNADVKQYLRIYLFIFVL